VFEAMGAGALDAVNTPVFERPDAARGSQALLAKIETIRKLVGNGLSRNGRASSRSDLERGSPSHDCLIAVGASAGGPAALAKMLHSLPVDFPAPIVVVQHVDPQFAPGLAQWLTGQIALKVRLARNGDRPQPGTVLLAGRGDHLVLTRLAQLTYTRQPADGSYRPSIDVFFKSVDRFWPGDIIGVLLTGMGRDGAAGLRALRNHGHHTIAQDEATSAVYGMPKAAAELHAAAEILPLGKIGLHLAARMRKFKIHV
jgi:two-component system chemotaxis response regulator CheB